MRPLTLTFTGIRSYLGPQTIDFTGKDFVAIVGDTGSGKSTVLDAICYALYNRCTWNGGSVGDLIAHGGDGTVSVAFTFSAGGKVWRVERSTSDRAASIHRLVSVDTDRVVATGARAVDTHIRRIIGLDCDTFLRAVILPQGRFQELLRMRDTDRSKILKSLLGLDQLSSVRDHAQQLHGRLTVRLAEYRTRRAAFLDDPATTLSDATRRRQTAQERLAALQAAQDAVAESVKAEAAASVREAAAEQARARLAAAIPHQADARYQRMLEETADISRRRHNIDRHRGDQDLEQQRLQAELDKATAEGTGVSAVSTAISTFDVLTDQLPRLLAKATRLAKEADEITLAAADLERRNTALTELLEGAAAAQHEVAGASARLEAAERAHRVASDVLTRLRATTDALWHAEQRHASCTQELQQLKATAETANAAADDADRALAVAEAAEEAERARSIRLRAAAVAADGCTPGDKCPVCTQTLPSDFVAPVDDTPNTAEAAVRTAKQAASLARSAAATTAERARLAETQTLADAARQRADATAERDRAAVQARDVFGDVDLTVPDDELLRSLRHAVQATTVTHDEAVVAHGAARDRHTQAVSELPVLTQGLARRQAAYGDELRDHNRTFEGLRRAAGAIPPAFGVDDGLRLDDIARQRTAATQRKNELAELDDRLAAIRGELRRLDSELRQLDDEQTAAVTGPAHEMRRQLDTLVDRAGGAHMLLGAEPHPMRPDGSSLNDEAAWCADMVRHANALVDRCARAAQDAGLAIAAARKAAEQARRSCGADDDAHLEGLVRLASTDQHNAIRDTTKARAQQPLTDELDRRTNAAAPAVAALTDLVGLLTDGKFIAEAVRQRQFALLGAASKLLLDISGGKFGFAENFRIIDTDTGRARDVRTLSGGETFQASLALALAVVELARRASGRVDSLFLDEGFGSLDSGVLQDALNALAAHTTAGRFVTVISHMRSIIEITDDVLVVERSFTGSRAHWASVDERERIINDDLSRGLLA